MQGGNYLHIVRCKVVHRPTGQSPGGTPPTGQSPGGTPAHRPDPRVVPPPTGLIPGWYPRPPANPRVVPGLFLFTPVRGCQGNHIYNEPQPSLSSEALAKEGAFTFTFFFPFAFRLLSFVFILHLLFGTTFASILLIFIYFKTIKQFRKKILILHNIFAYE